MNLSCQFARPLKSKRQGALPYSKWEAVWTPEPVWALAKVKGIFTCCELNHDLSVVQPLS
jgi:hypothetical protein